MAKKAAKKSTKKSTTNEKAKTTAKKKTSAASARKPAGKKTTAKKPAARKTGAAPKTSADKPLWTPSREKIADAHVTRFMDHVKNQWGVEVKDYPELHAWSVENSAPFWVSLKDYAGVVAGTWGQNIVVNQNDMMKAKWFPGARLNYAENLLHRRDETDAIVFWGEDKVKRRLSFNELYNDVSKMVQVLQDLGVTAGDRVAGYLPNMPETIIACLAASSIGAIWSSSSPDFGVQGVLDRFGQIEPKVLFAVNGYYYGGKEHDCLEKTAKVLDSLPTVEKCIVVPYTEERPDISSIKNGVLWSDAVAEKGPAPIRFERLDFNHPLFIMFSSGTTGVPKCIVHGQGGTLLQHRKEHLMQSDIKPNDRVFYFTTCGWMMWNWLITALGSQATLMLYDGSPFYPDGNVLFDFADAENMTHFGTSAKYIDAVKKAGLEPVKSHKLGSLKAILSTGSPLVPESFDFVYESIKKDVHLASIAGGTDIVSCFVLGDPTSPVWRGEIQRPGLGMKVEVYNEDGKPVKGEQGELVCSAAFPSQPVGFWNDPDDKKYFEAYFDRFENVWCHGDWIEETEHGGYIMYGRSDATLNPGGVRIGTAEIYRQVESLDEVMEAIVVGQNWDNDTRVVLFVKMAEGAELDDGLRDRIRKRIRENCTPRHVPAKILRVSDIPRTRSGKITELAVRNIIHGREVKNIEALANPEALDDYRNRKELEED